jgi:hypothetical protein
MLSAWSSTAGAPTTRSSKSAKHNSASYNLCLLLGMTVSKFPRTAVLRSFFFHTSYIVQLTMIHKFTDSHKIVAKDNIFSRYVNNLLYFQTNQKIYLYMSKIFCTFAR